MFKKSITITAVLMMAVIFTFGFIQLNGDPNADISPSVINGSRTVTQSDTIPPAGFPYPTQFNWNYSTIAPQNAGTVGALWVNGKYYLNSWNTTNCFVYDDQGSGGGPGTLLSTIVYAGACRDLSTDGYWVYAGNASSSIFRLDPVTLATVKTFNIPGGNARGIAWDPNRHGFWTTAFSGNITCYDTNGVLLQTITSALVGKYGLAFDSLSTPGQAFVWAWDQTSTTSASLNKYSCANGSLLNTFTFTLTGTSIGTAGGCEVVKKGNQVLMLCNYQNFAVVGYLMRTISSPPTWTPVDSLGISLNCVSTVNANVAWIGGAGGKVLKTTNGGASFVQMTNATIGTNDIYAIAGIDANTCLVSTSPAATFVFKTTDGGTTFTQVFTQVSGFIDDIRMQNATTGFMYGDPVGLRWSLWKTTNAGTTWDSTGCYLPQAGTESGYNNAMCLRGNTIWFGTGNTRVYKSTNFGATGSWISGATTGSANSYSVSFNGAVGFSGTTAAVKSTDGGATYTGVTVPGSGNLFAFNGIPNTGRFWFCRGASIYNSTDNGATFNTTPQYTRTGTFQAMDLKLDGTTIRGFAVTALGIIARFNEGGVVTSITPISTTTTPDSYQLGQNYPNPFNPTTKINFALPKSGLVTLKVYDVVGKEVATLVNEVKNVGTYSVDFNASNLSSGIYFYKVSVNGFSEVKKMMLIK